MTTATPPAQAISLLGCSPGNVCIYRGDLYIFAYPIPGDIYYTYGFRRIYNKIGNYYVKNNQTGGASVKLCTDLNGAVCPTTIPAGGELYVNLTPINSINLVK
ncbi:hypothetical protein [Nostoc sp.]|uniref:hypothetical protein n=1 Tax=Nostoc sp. TaxID=1180 RepID=UPI002FF6014E